MRFEPAVLGGVKGEGYVVVAPRAGIRGFEGTFHFSAADDQRVADLFMSRGPVPFECAVYDAGRRVGRFRTQVLLTVVAPAEREASLQGTGNPFEAPLK